MELEILRLWPSIMLDQALPEHEAHTRQLIELAIAHPGQAAFAMQDESVDWLRGHVTHGVNAYLHKAGFTHDVQWGAAGRFELQSLEDYRSLRNQPSAYLTGIYVASAPSADEGLGERDDRRPGCITFYDPRTGINMNAINKDPYILYNRTRKLVPGLLLIWPAYVNYFLHPNLSREPAIRIAFDIQVQGAPGVR